MTKMWTCPLCRKLIIDSARAKQLHLLDEMKRAQLKESEWYGIGKEALRLYRTLFSKEP